MAHHHLHADDQTISLYDLDEFYVFERPSGTTVAPTRVPLDSLPTLNLLKDLVDPSTSAKAAPLIELSSAKSGLRLTFDSNRACLLPHTPLFLRVIYIVIIVTESGVQFYTANFVGKDGARKKIHGGTGKVGQGDGYGPGSEPDFLTILRAPHLI